MNRRVFVTGPGAVLAAPLGALTHVRIAGRRLRRLLKAWKRAGDPAIPEPPRPLILGGWAVSSDAQKQNRWVETLRWATQHGFRRLIPEINERNAYRGAEQS